MVKRKSQAVQISGPKFKRSYTITEKNSISFSLRINSLVKDIDDLIASEVDAGKCSVMKYLNEFLKENVKVLYQASTRNANGLLIRAICHLNVRSNGRPRNDSPTMCTRLGYM